MKTSQIQLARASLKACDATLKAFETAFPDVPVMGVDAIMTCSDTSLLITIDGEIPNAKRCALTKLGRTGWKTYGSASGGRQSIVKHWLDGKIRIYRGIESTSKETGEPVDPKALGEVESEVTA